MAEDRIEREIVINAPVQRVWEVLTSEEEMPAWFSGATATVDLRPGGEIVFHWAEHGTFHARVERVEPPHLLVYRWSLLPDEEPDTGNATRVEFALSAEGAGTRLRVVETGFAGLSGDEQRRLRHLASNRQGWDAALAGLQAHAGAAGGASSAGEQGRTGSVQPTRPT